MPVHIPPPWPPEFFSAGPMIISESQTHIVVAVEVAAANSGDCPRLKPLLETTTAPEEQAALASA